MKRLTSKVCNKNDDSTAELNKSPNLLCTQVCRNGEGEYSCHDCVINEALLKLRKYEDEEEKYKLSSTEKYIVLKPISERFNNVTRFITDKDIKIIIESEIRQQFKKLDFTSEVNEVVQNYIEDNENEIISMFKTQLESQFKK